MQELHPSRPIRDFGEQYRVHRRCSHERDREPKYRAQDYEQCGVRREMPAFSEHPRHTAFEGNMHNMFKRPVANLTPEPRPAPAGCFIPLPTSRLGKRKEMQNAVNDGKDAIAKNLD